MDRGPRRRPQARAAAAALPLVGLIPLALLTYLAISLASSAVSKQVRARVAATATIGTTYVDRELRSVAELVSAYAQRRSVVAAASGRPADTPLSANLAELRTSRPDLIATSLVDRSGRNVAISPPRPDLIGKDFSFRDWFQGVSRTQQPYVSEVFQSPINAGLRTIAVATPVRSAGARTIAYLNVAVATDAIQGYVDRFKAEQGVSLTVTDQRGNVVAAPGLSPAVISNVAGAADTRAALEGRAGTVTYGDGGDRVLSGYARVPGIGWTVSATVPADTAFASVNRLRTTVLAIAAFLAVVVLGFFWMLLRADRERVRVAAGLRESEERARRIVESAMESFLALDATGRITDWNGQAERTFGYAREEAIGRRIETTVVPGRLRDAFRAGLEPFLSGAPDAQRVDGRLELTAAGRDGREFPVEVAAWSVATANGPRLNVFVHDISDRKAAEARLVEAYERERLTVAKLQDLDRAKTDFMSSISHELRTPLTSIMGYLEMLTDGDAGQLTAEQTQLITVVVRNSDRLMELIADLLTLSRIESGAFHVKIARVRFADLAEQVRETLAPSIAKRHIELAVVVDPDVGEVLADAVQMERVLSNLLTNAVKFSHDRGRIDLHARRRGDEVVVTVADDGIGVPEDELPLLFDRFFRATSAQDRAIRGTGLSLSIVQSIVTQQGGTIDVASEPGRGTTVTFTVPAAPAGGAGEGDDAPVAEAART